MVSNALLGDCLLCLREMPEASVDAVVTDPPYELAFMGKAWDAKGTAHNGALWREVRRVLKPGGYLLAFGAPRTYHRLACAVEDAGFTIRDSLHWFFGTGFPKGKKQLKPAHEPIVLACNGKPGGLNIDECRIDGTPSAFIGGTARSGGILGKSTPREAWEPVPGQGRWPANVLLDDEAAAVLDAQSGDRPSSKGTHPRGTNNNVLGKMRDTPFESYGDSGGASRFFYVAKASRKERGAGNNHPTVKPVALMRWLVRLVTPPGGLVLDPFMGSGTTGIAAAQEGFRFLGMEQDEAYHGIALRRLAATPPAREEK